MKKENKELLKLVGHLIFIIVIVFSFPLFSLIVYGKFTYDLQSVMEENERKVNEERYKRVAEYCEFNVMQTSYGYECDRPCVKYSLDDKNCVRKGCVDTGFLGLGLDCGWYVCEGYGDIKAQCLQVFHGTREEYCESKPDDEWYCRK